MNLHEILKDVKTKDDFVHFLLELKRDSQNNISEWENNSISEYLEAVGRWAEDMDGYYENLNIEKPHNVDWNFIATLFYVGKIYE